MMALFERVVAFLLATITVAVLLYLTFSEYDRRVAVAQTLEQMRAHVANDQIFSAILCYRVQVLEQASPGPAHLDCPNLLRHMIDGDLINKPNGAAL